MKEDTKKTTKSAAKSPVKVKDMPPKKDAKGGAMRTMNAGKQASHISVSNSAKGGL